MTETTTVICAVWHKDANRHQLLKGHAANLLAQTRPVRIVYVFDGGDQPPADLPGEKIVSSAALSIYEAWNLALVRCLTPYVMNLNLDDRLHADAVSRMEDALNERPERMVTGGDWHVRFSQADTDATLAVSPSITGYPFVGDWPPKADTHTRLGSARERSTLGPATMWRMSAHLQFPRYPYRTLSGRPLRSISDALWWMMLRSRYPEGVCRLPFVIGNYFSHPDAQAEFRYPGDDEWKVVKTDHVALL